MTDRDDHRQPLFDQWARTYDAAVAAEDGFPFAGYTAVLAATVRYADSRPGASILDIGTGTGTLANLFLNAGCVVTGIDHSPEMLRIATDRLPAAEFLPVDLLGSWEALAGRRFEVIVSAYVFHEFDLETKLALIERFAQEHLAAEGRIVLADIGFTTATDRDAAHHQWSAVWDEDEHYWAADEALPRLRTLGFAADWHQISSVAGVYDMRYRRER